MPSTDAAFWCVVPAAGSGTRFGGGVPKQYLPLAGKPLLLHTLERLAAHPRIAGLMIALVAGDPHWPGLSSLHGKPVLTCIGGGERADSVLAGLRALAGKVENDDFVLVHDAARPCVREDDITRL
ncbi:2-C-methyl-D-erythritol 4-phosphate cytidylyltransferase, partial [Rudaea sp.]|uniref:2-C-methyl-D-erythritol 4-phosphate cytidylyltransferase n=1 Tax=Rudaea sp. TaxID=2136325 RepID=UPI002ED6963A